MGEAGESTEVHSWELILSTDEMNFTVNWFFRGQIGFLMKMGKGAASSPSDIMKCNTQSFTETDLISAVHHKLPDCIWTFVNDKGMT